MSIDACLDLISDPMRLRLRNACWVLVTCSIIILGVVQLGYSRGWQALFPPGSDIWSWVSPAFIGILAALLLCIALAAILFGKRVPSDHSKPELIQILAAFIFEQPVNTKRSKNSISADDVVLEDNAKQK